MHSGNESPIVFAENRKLPDLIQEKLINISKNGFSFIQASDPQFGLRDVFENVPKPWTFIFETKLAEIFVSRVNKIFPRPAFIIICGDLVNSFPGDSNRINEENEFFRIFQTLSSEVPLVCVCGNHDVGDKPNPQSIETYTKRFGDDYFSFNCGPVKFIVLNSQLYFDCSESREQRDCMDSWLEGELKEGSARSAPIFVMQHIPLFIERSDEPNHKYFNLPIRERSQLLDRFMKAGVSYVFCGHFHRNAGGQFLAQDGSGRSLEVVVTSAIGYQLGEDKSGLRVVTVSADGKEVTHRYLELENEAHW